MNSKQTSGSMLMVMALSGAVGLVAFVALMVVGNFGFSAAFILALVIAAIVFFVLLKGFHDKPSAGQGLDHRAAPASAAAPAPMPAASAKTAAAATADEAIPAGEKTSDKGLANLEKQKTEKAEKASGDKPAPAAPAAKKAAGADKTADYDGDGKFEGENEGSKPATLDAPREGGADDLKKIKGVGPKMEAMCNKLGFYHFDQIAGWTPDEVAWVDANLQGFKGRVSRDAWVEQAKLLASGAETEFSKKVDKGGVY